MLITKVRGLKYPDIFVIRFFFKENLFNKKEKKVLELGCGNGNNLDLFYQYGYEITGVDLSASEIKKAEFNFRYLKNEHSLMNKYEFIEQDMVSFVEKYKRSAFDVLIMPNVLCYLSYQDIEKTFSLLRRNGIVKKGTKIFLSTRTPQDYRFKHGTKISAKMVKINFKETDEYGCLMTFLSGSNITKLLRKYIGINNLHVIDVKYDNLENGKIVSNADVILWGQVK